MKKKTRFKFIGYLDTENDKEGNVTLITLILNRIKIVGREYRILQKETFIFKSKATALLFLSNLSSTLIYTHNLEYDLVNLYGENFPYLTKMIYLKSRLIMAGWNGITYYDTFLHFPVALAKLGDDIGLKKLVTKDMTTDEKYAMRDVEILDKAMSLLHSKVVNLCGEFVGATSGSTAVKIWKSLTRDEFVLGHYDPPLARASYYGGRTEIFRFEHQAKIIGEEKGEPLYDLESGVFGYDVNSMYPYVMRFNYPMSLVADNEMKKDYGLIDAEFEISENEFVGSLPVRYEKRLIYPTGKFRTTVTYHEARQPGIKILKIHQALGTNSFCQPFKKFVDTLYDLRLKSPDKSESIVWKGLLNSLYGKMVSKGAILTPIDEEDLLRKLEDRKHWKNSEQLVYTQIANRRYLYESKRPVDEYVNVLWGSYITSYARIELNRILQANKKTLMYCDTDSCYVIGRRIEGCKIGSTELGCVKLEKHCVSAKFIQPKLYQLKEVKNGRVKTNYTAKGIPAPLDTATLERDQRHRANFFEKGYASFVIPNRFRQTVRTNISRKNKGLKEKRFNLWETKRKQRATSYYKHPVGNEFHPLRLPKDGPFIAKVQDDNYNGQFIFQKELDEM